MTLSRFIQEHYLITDGEINTEWINMDAAALAESDSKILTNHRFLPCSPNAVLISDENVHWYKIGQAAAHTSTRINLARIAIALELYRRTYGNYPSTLTPLVPNYIDVLPLDLCTGNSLQYRIKSDGTPLIYSFGLNKSDEGGLLKKNHTLGDWVWQYTLPEDFDEEEWRK